MKESLSVLEGRILSKVPSNYHGEIIREFDRFRTEIEPLSEYEEKAGQAKLTDFEIEKLPTNNQHSNGKGFTVVQYQVLKGIAIKNGISDWTSKIDPELTLSENKEVLQQENTEYKY